MFEAELMAGGGEGFGAIGEAAICEELMDDNAMRGVEDDQMVQSAEDALCPFVREQTSEGEAGVVVDGDVKTFETGAWVAKGAITGGADA